MIPRRQRCRTWRNSASSNFGFPFVFLIEISGSDKFFLAQRELYWTLPSEQNTKEKIDRGELDLRPQDNSS
jgi:hypothetical protein